MHVSHLQYVPVSTPVAIALVFALVVVGVLLAAGLLRHVSSRLGIGTGTTLAILAMSLFGASVNIPVFELAGREIVAGREIDYFGMRYVVPAVVDQAGTVIAVNLGGAVIPVLLSLYLLERHRLWLVGTLATLIVAAVCYAIATPVRGLGIAIPIFTPPLASVIVALILSRSQAAPLAYISGSLGTLIGADLMNLDAIGSLGAPVASIGGAGTFDGIFVAGLIAVVVASFTPRPSRAQA